MAERWRSKKNPYAKGKGGDGGDARPTESELSARMAEAIERIERHYLPNLTYEGPHEAERLALDALKIQAMEDVADWETRWITLLRKVRRDL